jgi:hypothetical protein
MIKAPWSDDIIVRLNAYQVAGVFHPYTCGNDHCRSDLIATTNGWICDNCNYTQDWAHEPLTLEELNKLRIV